MTGPGWLRSWVGTGPGTGAGAGSGVDDVASGALYLGNAS